MITDEYGNPVGVDLNPFSRVPTSPNRPPFKPQPPLIVVGRGQLGQPIRRPFQYGNDSWMALKEQDPAAARFADAYRKRQTGVTPAVRMPIAPPRGRSGIGISVPGPRRRGGNA